MALEKSLPSDSVATSWGFHKWGYPYMDDLLKIPFKRVNWGYAYFRKPRSGSGDFRVGFSWPPPFRGFTRCGNFLGCPQKSRRPGQGTMHTLLVAVSTQARTNRNWDTDRCWNCIGYTWVQTQFADIDTIATRYQVHAAMHTVTHSQQKCSAHGHRRHENICQLMAKDLNISKRIQNPNKIPRSKKNKHTHKINQIPRSNKNPKKTRKIHGSLASRRHQRHVPTRAPQELPWPSPWMNIRLRWRF